jgi:hypothetical protein
MPDTYYPAKNGRYAGPGDPLRKLVGDSGPFGFMPANCFGQQDWIFHFNGGCSYVPTDHTETKTNSGTIGMAAGGIELVSGATSGNNTTFQMLRSISIATGKRIAFACRLNMTNIALGKAAFGLFKTGADPIGTIPVDGAWFEKTTAGTGVITGRTATASTATTSATLTTLVNSVDQEFGILIAPTSNSAGTVSFWDRAADAESWGTPVQQTTNFPTGAMRASFNITATSAAALTMTIPWWAVAMEL